jgi:hypothetical protein
LVCNGNHRTLTHTHTHAHQYGDLIITSKLLWLISPVLGQSTLRWQLYSTHNSVIFLYVGL